MERKFYVDLDDVNPGSDHVTEAAVYYEDDEITEIIAEGKFLKLEELSKRDRDKIEEHLINQFIADRSEKIDRAYEDYVDRKAEECK